MQWLALLAQLCRDHYHCPAPFTYFVCSAKGVFSAVPPYCGYFIPYHVYLPCFTLLTCLIAVYLKPV